MAIKQQDGDSAAEGVRRKYLYRSLVINQGIKIPSRLAKKLVGPDCAYHLYRNHHPMGPSVESRHTSLEENRNS